MKAFGCLLIFLCAMPALATTLYAYIDESGELSVADSKLDERYRAYRPGHGFLKKADIKTRSWRKGRHLSESHVDPLLRIAAKTHGLSFGLLKAVAAIESQFDPKALSPAGAMGIMQLMPATARSLNVDNAFDPAENIAGGAKYLARLLKRFKRVDLALAAYNAGPTAVQRKKGIPDIRETKNYVRNVMRLAQDYR